MSLPHGQREPKNPSDPGDALPRRPGRIHISARQRGVDITALGGIVLHLPQVLASLTVVLVVSYAADALVGPPWWAPAGCWALSGALAFHRPCERVMARRLFHLRYPTPEEDRKLRSVWREVAARAGVDGRAYQLWVEDSGEINALAAAGHIVGVTSHSIRTLPPAQLAGVMAHELGHHTRGHAWASLLVFWYALPGRLTWRLLLNLASRVNRLSTGAATLVIGLTGAVILALTTATYGLVLLPLATPYLAAAISRRSELRADEHAAGLGFAQHLMTVLGDEHEREAPERTAEGILVRLLDSHPETHTRLHHLQAYLDGRR